MIAEIYELIVSDSVIDMVHNVGYSIVELYIPNKKIAFNEANDSFHCFITKKDRYKDAVKVGIIEVPKAISLAMTDYINISELPRH